VAPGRVPLEPQGLQPPRLTQVREREVLLRRIASIRCLDELGAAHHP